MSEDTKDTSNKDTGNKEKNFSDVLQELKGAVNPTDFFGSFKFGEEGTWIYFRPLTAKDYLKIQEKRLQKSSESFIVNSTTYKLLVLASAIYKIGESIVPESIDDKDRLIYMYEYLMDILPSAMVDEIYNDYLEIERKYNKKIFNKEVTASVGKSLSDVSRDDMTKGIDALQEKGLLDEKGVKFLKDLDAK